MTQMSAINVIFPKDTSVLCKSNYRKSMCQVDDVSQFFPTQKFRYLVGLSREKTPDVVTGHTDLHGFCLLPAKKGINLASS